MTTDPDLGHDDLSIHDTMRVVDGVVRPPGSAWPNGASQVPASHGATAAEQEGDAAGGDGPPARVPRGG
jgi:hypothetical protein